MAGGLGIALGVHVRAGLGRQPLELRWGEKDALLAALALIGRDRGADLRDVPAEVLVLAAQELADLLADTHGAPVVAAHGAEVRVDVEILIVVGARRVRIE